MRRESVHAFSIILFSSKRSEDVEDIEDMVDDVDVSYLARGLDQTLPDPKDEALRVKDKSLLHRSALRDLDNVGDDRAKSFVSSLNRAIQTNLDQLCSSGESAFLRETTKDIPASDASNDRCA